MKMAGLDGPVCKCPTAELGFPIISGPGNLARATRRPATKLSLTSGSGVLGVRWSDQSPGDGLGGDYCRSISHKSYVFTPLGHSARLGSRVRRANMCHLRLLQ